MQTVAKQQPTPFATRLRELREGAGKTQVEAAKAANVHIQTYMRWERGGSEPTFTELAALALEFGTTLNDFQGGAE